MSVVMSRRSVLGLLGAAALTSTATTARNTNLSLSKPLRVRTITVGVNLSGAADLRAVASAIDVLKRGRTQFEEAGYEVETVRIATQPFLAGSDRNGRDKALDELKQLDRLAAEHGTIVSIGPVLTENRLDADLAAWAAELVRTTRTISFSVVIASPQGGVHDQAAVTAAQTMSALATALKDGIGNFRFAAAAGIPAGTPFFPVAWHQGPRSLAIGLESASVVEDAFARKTDEGAGTRLQALMNETLQPSNVWQRRGEPRRLHISRHRHITRTRQGSQHRCGDRSADPSALWQRVDTAGLLDNHRGNQNAGGEDLRILGADAARTRRSVTGATRRGRTLQHSRSAAVFKRVRNGPGCGADPW